MAKTKQEATDFLIDTHFALEQMWHAGLWLTPKADILRDVLDAAFDADHDRDQVHRYLEDLRRTDHG